MPGFSLATAYYHIALSHICILATAAVGKKKKKSFPWCTADVMN